MGAPGPWQRAALRDKTSAISTAPRRRPRGDQGVSNPESFIDEVSEEVRRDRLYRNMRRYGWIPLLAVLAIVGGAAWVEWQRSQDRSAAEARGDALLAALEIDDATGRIAALEALPTDGAASAVGRMLLAAEQQRAGEIAAAEATLQALAVDAAAPELYRDVAALKAAMLTSPDTDPAQRLIALEALAAPGAPFRMLALEQIALVNLAQGDTEAALDQLRQIIEAAEVTPGLRDRAEGLMVALGVAPETAPQEIVETPDAATDAAADPVATE